MSRRIVLNTLAYKQIFSQDPALTQLDILQEIKAAGYQDVEIRREYVKAGEEEIKRIAVTAEEQNLNLYYSVPDELFKDSELNPVLEMYFKEAAILNSSQVKLNLGKLHTLLPEQAQKLLQVTNTYPAIRLLIENDQNQEKSNSLRLKTFMEQAKEFNVPVGLTFDIGNFHVIQEDVFESVNNLLPYVEYVHIKNAKKTETGYESTDIASGDVNIEKVLKLFPPTILCGIEYSCGGKEEIQQKMEYERNLILEMAAQGSL
ncbi:sugar phosphate isomerase/epimerase family protein [Cytobacillus gottheilii]|uniref:sugar phosphate isomerase/epimerase family protein n=1 Tax=Cytobacillus gottheilii TaxID=859144 RepID=UPI0024953CEB|nr:hypothetical protein [Cytobacillus gottheilii]